MITTFHLYRIVQAHASQSNMETAAKPTHFIFHGMGTAAECLINI